MNKAIFKPTVSDTDYQGHNGQLVKVWPLDEVEYDREEVGPMFVVEAADGWTGQAFGDELEAVK